MADTEIIITPEELLAHYISRLDSILQDLDSGRTALTELMALAEPDWKGRAESSFYEKAGECRKRLDTVKSGVTDARDSMTEIFDVMEQEALAAAEAAAQAKLAGGPGA